MPAAVRKPRPRTRVRHLEAANRPFHPRAGISPRTALLVIGGALMLNGLVSRRFSPDPSHPHIQRWVQGLGKALLQAAGLRLWRDVACA
jgi:hypothetical protein